MSDFDDDYAVRNMNNFGHCPFLMVFV